MHWIIAVIALFLLMLLFAPKAKSKANIVKIKGNNNQVEQSGTDGFVDIKGDGNILNNQNQN